MSYVDLCDHLMHRLVLDKTLEVVQFVRVRFSSHYDQEILSIVNKQLWVHSNVVQGKWQAVKQQCIPREYFSMMEKGF